MHDVFRTLRRLPSFLVKPFQRRYTRIKFLDLPDDIIYEISGHLSVRSLCNLSLTCHHLYFSLLFPHLRRLGLDDPFTQIHLDGQNTTDALPALRLLLFPSPIKTLSWKAGNDPRGLVREAEQLRRLVARIPSVEFLELDFSNNWPVSESRYGHSENSYWAWIRVCTNLLHVVAQKCHFVVITNHYQVLAPWLTFIGGKPYNLDDGLLSRICAEWKADLETKKVRLIRSPSKISLSSPPHAHSNETFSPPFPPSQSAPTTPGYTTARLIINDPGLFQRSLFGEWALKWVNMMPLTHLVIHQGRMRLPLLRQLRLPDLVHLTISRGYGLTTADMIQILQSNTSLSTLDCLETKIGTTSGIVMLRKPKKGLHRGPGEIGSSLDKLKGTATFLRRMLEMELGLGRLTTITVQLRAENIQQEQASLLRFYKALSHRKSVSTLIFELPPPPRSPSQWRFEKWLELGADGGKEENFSALPGSMLRHIKSVHICRCPGSDSSIPMDDLSSLSHLLIKWLSNFPSLHDVGFTGLFDKENVPSFVDYLHLLCPNLTVRVDGERWSLARYVR